MQMSFNNIAMSDMVFDKDQINAVTFYEANQITMWPCLAVQIAFFFFLAVLAFLALSFIKHQQR